jgi:hypothetical protein
MPKLSVPIEHLTENLISALGIGQLILTNSLVFVTMISVICTEYLSVACVICIELNLISLLHPLLFPLESGCLLPSLPSDATFDRSSGISFICDLNDNIPAPWPSKSQLSAPCNKSMSQS